MEVINMSGTYQNENFSEEVQETVQQENKVTVISTAVYNFLNK